LEYIATSNFLFQITAYLVAVGAIMTIAAIISLLWFCNVKCGDHKQITLATIVFDVLFGGLYLATAVASAVTLQ
jgi:hypothetical protein